MIVVVMGVAGSGKSTVGSLLAAAMGCPFVDADALHPPANIGKMVRGAPLTDVDRRPWLEAIRGQLIEALGSGRSLVVGCSALKASYRATLGDGIPIVWVYLRGPEALIRARLLERRGHYMAADMLSGQLEALEEPPEAIVADISRSPAAIVEHVLSRLPHASQAVNLANRQTGDEQRPMAAPDVRVFPDADATGLRAAEAVAGAIADAVRSRGRCSLVLSGGSTPRLLYRVLASRFRAIPWAHVHVFWGDERYVPHDHAWSNYRMAATALLDHVQCPASNVHPMPTHLADADDAAREYEATVRRYFAGGPPRFDVVLLGLGPDGHTASLFPGSSALAERRRWVVAVMAPAEPPLRLTLTWPALIEAAQVHVLVAGANKAEALHHVLAGTPDPIVYPAAGVRRARGSVVWWVDRDASAHLSA